MDATIDNTALPSADESAIARESSRSLALLLDTCSETQQFDLRNDKREIRSVMLPTSALKILVQVLAEIGQGNAVSIIPIRAELTTHEAADLLNVSRPHVLQLLEKGDITFRKVNTHRRVLYQDILRYRQRIDEARRKALDELAAQAQELDMGYSARRLISPEGHFPAGG